MNTAYSPILSSGKFEITGMDRAPKDVTEAFRGPLMRMADLVAAGILSQQIETSGMNLPGIKQIRVGVSFDAPAPGRGFLIYAFSSTAPKSQFWLPLSPRMPETFMDRLKAPFADHVMQARRHAPNGATLEYAAPFRELSNHEQLALRAA